MRLVRHLIIPLLLLCGSAAAAAGQEAAAAEAPLSLQPGDLVKVEIWREPDLSGQFLIDEQGDVVLPLLGKLHAADAPLDEFRASLFEAYRAELLNPSINITPLRRVYVLGEVNVPGLYPVDPTISIAGAVAMAGGANGQGNLRNIRVVHGSGEVTEGLSIDSPLAQSDIRSGDQIFVGRRSWFDRNSTFVVSALLSVTSIVISLAR